MSSEKIAISHFMLPREKGTEWQKKLMMQKAQELSMNMWHKTGSDVTPATKTNKGQEDLPSWKMRPCLKWLKISQAQTLVHYKQNLVLHKAQSIDKYISSALGTDTEILEIQKSFDFTQ